MEYRKIINLLDTTSDNVPIFFTKKCIEVHDQSGNADNKYKPSKPIRFKTPILQSDLCGYSDAYIVVKGTIAFADPNDGNYKKKLAFNNNTPFIFCILKINNTLIDNAEDLDIVMLMYNLIEYSKNYSITSGSLENYYRDEPNSGVGGENSNINYSIKGSTSFDHKTKITGKLQGMNRTKEVEFSVQLKHLSNF